MSLKEDVIDMKKEVNDIKEKSFAMELLSDARKTNKRMFIIILVLITLWFATIGGFMYYITHYTYEDVYEENTREIDDIDTIEDSYIINGGDIYGEDKTNQ